MEELMKKAVWISYDLGVRGDYEGIYAWLDDHKARECVGNLAFVDYECDGDDLLECLRQDLGKAIEVTKRTRIYVVWRDAKTRKVKGRFVCGGRRVPPWAGYGAAEEQTESDES